MPDGKETFLRHLANSLKALICFEMMNRLCNEDGGLDCDGSNDVAPQTKFCEFLLIGCENLYYVK